MQYASADITQQIASIGKSFPRIGATLALFWGEKEFAPYIDGLLNDTRSGTRQGFPPDVTEQLMTLLNAHDTAFPQYAKLYTDIWLQPIFGNYNK